ncbi:MAG: VapC toxin family PIN domain ribonuclease, partial [Acidimicrobiia bacterium]|nr:VapC toxin family PIN domain ribonuclease [Acidimicrobiia bacterium]
MILVDTTPLVALCDARDSKHRAAVKQLASLANEEFAVCDGVLTEACFHLPHRSQRQRLRALLHDLRVQPLPV